MANPLIIKKGKNYNFSETEKSKGILDDFAVRKVEQTRELTVSKSIMPSANDVPIGMHGNPFGNIATSTITFANPSYSRTSLFNQQDQADDIVYSLPDALPFVTDGRFLKSDAYGIMTWERAVPTGSIMMWATNTAPTGYLLCDGSTVAEATYAALFAVIGHSFGGDPGGGNFNLPNFTMRFPCGGDVAGGIRPVGTTGGSTAYTPAGVVSSHTTTTANFLGGITAILTGPLAHNFTGNPATIEPPYLAINFIIKY